MVQHFILSGKSPIDAKDTPLSDRIDCEASCGHEETMSERTEAFEEMCRRMLAGHLQPKQMIPRSYEAMKAQIHASKGNMGEDSPVVPAALRGRMGKGGMTGAPLHYLPPKTDFR